ncbi:hypothetical protein B0I35DRAFT_428098 [Stachybotrys elegans]|uniref:ER membrane protein complex subunit 7 beta-sandwich domain-containing protein n=1 Tax=Stachybotrys elegans TaxID=80388 RepID=A0A8K0WSK2_9HYPO|nr:hypothetical protein B0I35DRAFT_428098 [Stachybotrys elegans]
MRLTASLPLLGLIGAALAAELTLYLPAKPNPFTLPSSTRATLSALDSHLSAPLSSINTFVFRNVTPGSYLVDVHCPTTAFSPLRIDVAPDGTIAAWETFRGNDWANKGEALPVKEGSVGQGVELRARGPKNYFLERPKFSILSILKNPMILMGIVTLGLSVGMPKLLENMDPEMRAEFEARQRGGPMSAMMGGGGGGEQPQNPLGNFDMAAYLAGSNKQDGEAPKNGGGKR